MCTVTFFPFSDDRYIFSTNRDELRTRSKALPPELHNSGDISYSYPVDGEKGGTWVGTNQNGVSLCIMNWFQAYDPSKDYSDSTSRGKIIPDLISSKDLAECEKRINQMKLEQFQPFRLLGINAHPIRIVQWKWNGKILQKESHPVTPQLWISAGMDYDKVRSNRMNVFKTFLESHNPINLEAIKKLHASVYPEKSIYSIAMWHERASTVSTTIIDARNDIQVMHYLDGYPAKADRWVSVKL